MKNVLVFFGGVSPEHDISVITGVFTINCIDKKAYNSVPVYIHTDGAWYSGEQLRNISFYKNFSEKKLSRVVIIAGDSNLYAIKNGKLKKIICASASINALHGRNGEDGSINGILQLSNIPVASPDIFCASLSIDKNLTKTILRALDVATVPSLTVKSKSFFKDRECEMLEAVNQLGYPLIVKPLTTGSSIGISVANSFSELERAFELAFKFDSTALVESYIKGAVDINCAAYSAGGEIFVSECEKPVTANEILTFNDKYLGVKTGSLREFPAKIAVKRENYIRETTKKVYETLGFRGIIRIDYLIYEDAVFLNEINSVPGSLAYYLFCDTVSEFSGLLTRLVDEAIASYLAKSQLLTEFKTNVLLSNIEGVKK